MPALVPLPYSDIVSVTEAASYAGVSGETIRRWCQRFGIGRQFRGNGWREWRWQVSRPALRMVVTRDWEALEAFRCGDRTSPLVSRHFEPELLEALSRAREG